MLTAKRIANEALPPVLVKTYRRINSLRHDSDALFDGDDQLFKTLTRQCKIYAEYGCGQSTGWVLRNTDAKVYAVDSDRGWIANIRAQNNAANRLKSRWVDVGDLADWGRPLSYSKRSNFLSYTDWPWTHAQKPQVVLIDGRFRVCCFLTCLKNASEGTKLLFDDYVHREHYHVVEEFVELSDVCGRQALFVVPPRVQIDFEKLHALIKDFRLVLE